MVYHVISALKSVMFIGMYLIAMYLFVPKGIKFWRLWKETGRPLYFSNAISCAVGAFFLLSADFLIFMMAIGGFRV